MVGGGVVVLIHRFRLICRDQLENEKRKREAMERERQQMEREKQELMTRLSQFEETTKRAERGEQRRSGLRGVRGGEVLSFTQMTLSSFCSASICH